MEVVLGTMTFGPRCTQEESAAILKHCKESGVTELDTAIMYGGGETEVIMGRIGMEDFRVATKANPFKTTPQPVEVGLSPTQVRTQLQHSLDALKVESVDLFYLHAPDHDVPIMETLMAVNKLHQTGKFKRFGLSNYSAWQVAEIWQLCDRHDFVKPTVYQGMYNAITRQVELELFPCLRHYNISFYAYNPLAGGILTGRYKREEQPREGRFNVTSQWGQKYRERYWKNEVFDVVDQLRGLCDKEGTTVAEAALRWCVHHSQMDASKGDKLIIGASSLKQCRSNIAACQAGPLPTAIVEVFDAGWAKHQPFSPCYFR